MARPDHRANAAPDLRCPAHQSAARPQILRAQRQTHQLPHRRAGHRPLHLRRRRRLQHLQPPRQPLHRPLRPGARRHPRARLHPHPPRQHGPLRLHAAARRRQAAGRRAAGVPQADGGRRGDGVAGGRRRVLSVHEHAHGVRRAAAAAGPPRGRRPAHRGGDGAGDGHRAADGAGGWRSRARAPARALALSPALARVCAATRR